MRYDRPMRLHASAAIMLALGVCATTHARGQADSNVGASSQPVILAPSAIAKVPARLHAELAAQPPSFGVPSAWHLHGPGVLDAVMLTRIQQLTHGVMQVTPKDLSPDLIDAMTECEKVCEHIHLPLQAGSNEILRKMNRQYTREDYLKLVDRLRQRIPDIAISTDLIVGFPGETEEDFQDTLDMVEKIQYDSAFTFIYSPRRGTPAARMQEQLDEDVKKERLNRLIELQNDISKSKNQQYMGKVVEVLVEGISKNNPKMLSSRTRTNKLVHFEGGSEIIGEFVKVKITEPKAWTLEGYMI